MRDALREVRGTQDALLPRGGVMETAELTQFLFVCAIAVAALIAAPIVAYLAEASERRPTHGRGQRRISTQQPVMQY